ncbi:MAG: hypothetical protein IJC50_08290 [Clostridia bacterium]|nr:hypothetical protein [Clostridia bacterium]
MQPEKLYVSGNSSLLLCHTDADIPIIRAPSNAPSFCSLKIINGESRIENRLCHADKRFRRTFYGGEYRNADMIDRFDEESSAFVRRCLCFEDIPFVLSFEKEVRFLFTAPIKTTRASYPAACIYLPAGSCVAGFETSPHDRFLLIAFFGCAEFDPVSGRGVFLTGESGMAILADDDPNRLVKNAAAVLGKASQELGTPFPDVKPREEHDPAEYINALISLTTNEGFVLSDPIDLNIDPLTQYFAVRAFLHAGMSGRALAIIDAYCNRFKEKGEVFWCERGSKAVRRSACEGSLTPALIILAALAFPKGILKERHFAVLCEMMKHQRSFLLNFTMPFNGNEDEFEARYLPYQGSSLATLLFIQSGRELCRRLRLNGSEELEDIEKLVDGTASHFHANFIKEGVPLLNAPMRDAVQPYPRFRFGYCESCAPRSLDPRPCWLKKTPSGAYLCPSCTETNPNGTRIPTLDRNAKRVSYATVLWSAMLGSEVYPRGLIKQIASSIISYPTEVKSAFDAALLCYAARRYELDLKYVSAADGIFFTGDKPKDIRELKTDAKPRYVYSLDAKSQAIMYTLLEYHAIPKRKTKKRPAGAMFDQNEDVR